MNVPKVSIVVPVYRIEENLLRRCIESCLNQTIGDVEVILVDDCSGDVSSVICDEYQSKSSQIKAIHKNDNQGLSAARNTGVYAASGEWLMFVDGDDWIEANTCELINGSEDKDLIFFGMKREYGNKSVDFLMPYKDGQCFDEDECKELQEDILDYNKRLSTAYCKIVKKNIIMENNLYHNELIKCGIEGIEYNLRLFGVIKSAVYKAQYKYHYVFNKNSITGAPNETTNQYILDGLKCIKSYIASVPNNANLMTRLESRTQRIIFDTAIGSYFNPNYKISYALRKNKLKEFVDNDVIKEILHKKEYYEKNFLKRLIYHCVIGEKYWMLFLVGTVREKYLRHR